MVVWIIVLIAVFVTAFIIAAFVLPNRYLKTRYTLSESLDRGIKMVEEKNGRSIVYEPSLKCRKYIKQYVLSERGKHKGLVCKVDKDVSYIAYDIAVFDNRDELVTVIAVKEKVEDPECTRYVELPRETSYVALTVTQADTETFTLPVTAKVEGRKLLPLILWTLLCVVMETLCVRVCFANIFGGVFREIMVLDGESALQMLLIMLCILVINIVVCLIALSLRGRKKVWTE